MIQRRMRPLPRGAGTASRRRAPNRPSLEMSMGRASPGIRLREPLGDVLGLHDHLAVDLPGAILLEEGVELVLGEPELVHEAVLGGEDVRHPGRGALDLAGTDMDENPGNLIRTLRQKLSMTQEEFAHEIAVTVSTVNRWENAHAEPSKLAWKAIHDLARKRGLTEDILRLAGALSGG